MRKKFEEGLLKISQKLGNQRHLKAVASGMMMILPLIIIGSLFMIIANPPVSSEIDYTGTTNIIIKFLLKWKAFSTQNYGLLTAPFDLTMGVFSLMAVFAISYQLAKSYKLKEMNVIIGMTSMIMFLIVTNTPLTDGKISLEYLGGNGLFVAIIIAIISTEIFRLIEVKKWQYVFPESVPPMVSSFVNSLLPVILNIIVLYGINILLIFLFQKNLPSLITTMLTPGLQAVNNIWVYLAITIFANILWMLGINGTSIIFPLVFTMGIANTGLNAEAVMNGKDPQVLMNLQMFRYMILGGAGNTLGLVLLMMKSKSVQLKTIGRLSIVPGICGINEPVIFGSPIVFNPVLGIPFIIMPVISTVLGYLVQLSGLVKPGYIIDPSFTPFFIQAYLSALDWRNVVFVFLLVIISIFVYLPFFRIFEKKILAEELLNAESQSETAASF
ncbi:PTS sugar transporter subunit IIC [Sebaldella sp. S0638]|uniref:PTS sugar transporter subunit IIC n=1 Tax=Sebaldella sp. S0638 TaxID=2957809 RepID=UPI00209EE82A|nr:PTS transporter subunit EIIC [Sebaldella sp. S0638]MCP1225834.1 PTS transporter subunit EIIC [Sebaldella sp. S0638]